MTGFVIVGTQRSGTTFIRHCLNSHPDICCHGELFQKRYKGSSGYYSYVAESPMRKFRHVAARRQLVSDYLDSVYSNGQAVFTGFKLMRSQVRLFPYGFPSALGYLKVRGIRVVQIVRRNVLKNYLSRLSAQQRNLYHAKEKVDAGMVEVPVGTLIRELHKIDKENKDWPRIFNGYPYQRIDYEDFVSDKEKQSKLLLEFLGVPEYRELTSSNVKINPDDLSLLIKNYDEVAACLDGSVFDYCLD